MDFVREINEHLENAHVKRFREQDGQVVGYSCTFTPVEVLEAAGLFPFRLKALGHPQTDRADARMSRFNCRFCRACLQLGLDGTYGFLEGLVQTNGCDQLRGMFENWQYSTPTPFFHYLKAPHVLTPDALDYFTREIQRFREAVEAHFEVTITDDQLRAAMAGQARIREKLSLLHGLREQAEPALTGSEALQLALAGSSVPAAQFEELLDRALSACTDRVVSKGRARLLLGGAATDEPQLIEAVENLGGLVVTDTFCFGTRSYLPQSAVETDDTDPVRAMAERYLFGSRCPRMYDAFDSRYDFVHDAAKRAGVEGVILVNNKFCDLHGFDNAMLRRRLEEADVPVLSLEKDYGSQADQGRVRTRVQAFLERIGGGA